MEHRIGPHSLHIDGNLASVVLVGELLVEHIPAFFKVIDTVGDGQDALYLLVDISLLQGMSAEVRRLAVAWKGLGRAGDSAIVGATVFTRTLVLLISRAASLVRSKPRMRDLAFFKTEEEARLWLNSRRTPASARSLRS